MIIKAACGCFIDDNCNCAPTMTDLEKQLQAADELARAAKDIERDSFNQRDDSHFCLPTFEHIRNLVSALAAYEKVRGLK